MREDVIFVDEKDILEEMVVFCIYFFYFFIVKDVGELGGGGCLVVKWDEGDGRRWLEISEKRLRLVGKIKRKCLIFVIEDKLLKVVKCFYRKKKFC